MALIEVDAEGETTIVVAPGANAGLGAAEVDVADADAVLCQLEIPDAAVLEAAASTSPLLLSQRGSGPADGRAPDLLVVNRLEHEVVEMPSAP